MARRRDSPKLNAHLLCRGHSLRHGPQVSPSYRSGSKRAAAALLPRLRWMPKSDEELAEKRASHSLFGGVQRMQDFVTAHCSCRSVSRSQLTPILAAHGFRADKPVLMSAMRRTSTPFPPHWKWFDTLHFFRRPCPCPGTTHTDSPMRWRARSTCLTRRSVALTTHARRKRFTSASKCSQVLRRV